MPRVTSCGSCGSPVGPEDQFCGNCGGDLSGQAEVDEVDEVDQGGPASGAATGDHEERERLESLEAADADDPAGAGRAADPAAGPGPGTAASFTDPDHPALFDRPVRTLTPETVRVDLDDEPTHTGADAPTEVIAVTGGVDLATCSGCGAVNAVERLRCARCGTPLHDDVDDADADDDWELQALPSTDEPAEVPQPVRGERRHRGLGVAIVVVGALLGAGLAAWVFGVGPFERTAGVEIDFVGEDYPGQAGPVAPERARTSEVRADEAGRSFGAGSAVDGDLTTAWVAVDPDEARLEYAFDRPVWVTGIELANGDQFDDESFEQTGRIRTLDMDFGFDTRLRATLISGTGAQVVRPPEPILTDRVVLDVAEVTEGEGVGLSEISFIGFPADDVDTQAWDEAT